MSSARTSWSVQLRIERPDQRLHDACGAVDWTAGPTRLPVRASAARARSRAPRSRRRSVRRWRRNAGLCRTLGKFQIGRRVVARICADHRRAGRRRRHRDRASDRTSVPASPAAGGPIDGFDQIDRRLQLGVDPVHQRVGLRRKRASRQHEGAAPVRRQVRGRLFCETHGACREATASRMSGAHRTGDGDRHFADQLPDAARSGDRPWRRLASAPPRRCRCAKTLRRCGLRRDAKPRALRN